MIISATPSKLARPRGSRYSSYQAPATRFSAQRPALLSHQSLARFKGNIELDQSTVSQAEVCNTARRRTALCQRLNVKSSGQNVCSPEERTLGRMAVSGCLAERPVSRARKTAFARSGRSATLSKWPTLGRQPPSRPHAIKGQLCDAFQPKAARALPTIPGRSLGFESTP